MTAPTDDEIRAALEAEKKATPGPWNNASVEHVYAPDGLGGTRSIIDSCPGAEPWMSATDAAFITTARNLLRPLAEEVLAAREELARLREVLRQCWYWFDDHDDRMTSGELHRMLHEATAAAKEPRP